MVCHASCAILRCISHIIPMYPLLLLTVCQQLLLLLSASRMLMLPCFLLQQHSALRITNYISRGYITILQHVYFFLFCKMMSKQVISVLAGAPKAVEHRRPAPPRPPRVRADRAPTAKTIHAVRVHARSASSLWRFSARKVSEYLASVHKAQGSTDQKRKHSRLYIV